MQNPRTPKHQSHTKQAGAATTAAGLVFLALALLGARPVGELVKHVLPLPYPPVKPDEDVLRNLGVQSGLFIGRNRVKDLQARVASDYLYDKLMELNSPKGYQSLRF